jgi:hypothetical protein
MPGPTRSPTPAGERTRVGPSDRSRHHHSAQLLDPRRPDARHLVELVDAPEGTVCGAVLDDLVCRWRENPRLCEFRNVP